jgi:adsorption protein B
VIVTINFFFLVNRILHRAWFTGLNHGLKHVPLTPIRIVTSNLISFGAFWRASRQYISHLITRRPIAWDKTQHAYPSLSELQQGSGRLGETLRFWNHVSEADLTRALEAQKSGYRPLGLLLLDLAAVDDDHLAEAFAERGETYASIFDPFQIDREVLNLLTPAEAARYGAVPLRRNGSGIDVALAEPLPPEHRAALEKRFGQQGVRSVRFLFAPLSDIAFAIRFAWGDDPFPAVRDQLARLRAAGGLDASREAMLWRSVRAGYARLGDILIRQGRITHADLQTALAASRADGRSLGETLTRLRMVSAADIEAALKDQRSARWLNEQLAEALKSAPVDPRHEPV